ncbi:MAG: hypothetical protein M3P39_03490 [Actinomycetota bacterium]|nr:hypothetical protein [Actinomycetota bacterium]
MAATPEETLAVEARERPRAGAAAVAAGLLVFVGTLVTTLVFRGTPNDEDRLISLADALRNRVQTGRPSGPGLTVDQGLAFGEQALPLALGGTLLGVGVLAILPALAHLFRALRARNPDQRPLLLYALVAGTVLTGVGFVVFHIALAVEAAGLADVRNPTAGLVRETVSGGFPGAGQLLSGIGRIVLAVAISLIALAAMRVGLLTRFLGILGVIVGLLWVVPFDQFAFIRGFWLVALGLLILQRLPRVVPRAWSTGRAEPWPTRQELREGRFAASTPAPPDDEDAEPTPAADERGPTGARAAGRRRDRRHRS